VVLFRIQVFVDYGLEAFGRLFLVSDYLIPQRICHRLLIVAGVFIYHGCVGCVIFVGEPFGSNVLFEILLVTSPDPAFMIAECLLKLFI